MNIKVTKIALILLIVLMILPVKNLYAVTEMVDSGKKFLEAGTEGNSVISTTELKKTSDKIYNVLFAIGIVVMFIVGTIIGIQFMIASAEDKAKVKEALIPYAVGCAVILGSFTIWKIVVNIGNSL